jgi:hypothetical protein
VTNNYPASWQASIQTPITVNIPPKSGNYAGKTGGYVEVIVTYNQPRLFSSIFGTGSIPVTARAVAKGTYTTPGAAPAVMAQDSHPGDIALNAQNGQVIVQGAGAVIANANASTRPNGSVTTGGVIDVTGAWSGTFSPSPTATPTVPDPYAFLPAPTQPAAAPAPVTQGGITYYFPGTYSSQLSFSGNTTVQFHQGIYYLQQGISTSGNASFAMVPGETGGMLMYIAGGQVNLVGNGTYQLAGYNNSASPYNGFLFFQAHGNVNEMDLKGNGSGTSFSGFIYAPDAPLVLTGNGTDTVNHSGVLASTITIKGNNGTLNVVYNGSSLPNSRIIALVE